MPIGLDKAPNTLPNEAKRLWVDTFNGVLEDCEGTTKECDQRAAKISWDQIKRKYRKVTDKWVAKSEYEDSYHDLLLVITKASLQPDGSVRWQAVASDTGADKADEKTSVELFQDWIDRVTYGQTVSYLPEPKMPFLGVSHYPSLDGFGEAGSTYRMYIDGNTFKADGVFKADSPIGEKLLNAVKAELALIKKGNDIEKPIRISAGWWDIAHYHEDSNHLFIRQSLIEKCPICEKGQTSDKVYKAGQLDHFAATRVPMNVRTSLELKSMANKITRKEDAESIIGPDEAEEMEKRSQMVGKSDTEGELPDAMVVKAQTKIGSFIKRKREEMEMSITDLAAKTPVTDGTIGDIESGDIVTPSKPVIDAIAKALKVSASSLTGMLSGDAEPADKVAKNEAGVMGRGGYMRDMRKKRKMKMADVAKALEVTEARLKRIEDDEDEIDDGMMGRMSEIFKMSEDEKEHMLARFGKKRRKEPPTKKMDYGEGAEMAMPMMPFGGAKSLKEAEDYISTQEKMGKMYSYWDMLKAAYNNIQSDYEMDPGDKLKAVSSLFREMGSKIDTLKAGLSDAFLIQQSTAAYSEFEDDEDDDENAEIYNNDEDDDIMTEDQVQVANHPADKLKAAVDVALANKSLGRDGQETAVQKAFNTYAQSVQSDLDQANPLPVGDQIAGAIEKAMGNVLGPLTEQVGLLTAKMNQQEQPHPQSGAGLQQVYVPQQKSIAVGQTPQVVQQPGEGQMPVSPVTKKPSALTAQIRRSVGIID